ncbi:homeobox-leucine zipper protein PROTODERMAL FACTOR 2-like isoform X2 [Bidens hawaiensis]|uniref:homeobox-leucine zipper protein PROTODERMAL FACTOR 2-like isoform X2 n=1 Tax=Bidens hawaiensis TaxID=980011 RepID=UPI004049690B
MSHNNMFENLDIPRDDEQDRKSETDIAEAPSRDNDNQDPNDIPNNRRRYHRHTIEQIHEIRFYNTNPHPSNMQRDELGRRLNLDPLQIKFWFQNKRTQMKAQHERSNNSELRNLNKQLQAEHKRLTEALTNATCLNCGGPADIREMSIKHELIAENACLRDKIDRISEMTSNYYGKQVVSYTDISSSQGPSHSLDSPAANYNRNQGMVREMLEASDLPRHMVGPTASERPIIVKLAVAAMEVIIKMAMVGAPLWVPTSDAPSLETLNEDMYTRSFLGGSGPKPPGLKCEASRASKVVMMNHMNVVEILMNVNRWSNVFCGIVSRARTVEVLSTGVAGTYNGAMQVMAAEYQIPTPLVPTRETYFVRYCKQQNDGMWVVVDVSLDDLRSMRSRCRRRPSGCLIHGMLNGYSKVTWVEHLEVDDGAVDDLYKVLVNSGLAFGAKRWLATLERQCERLARAMASYIPVEDVGAITTLEGRRSMLKLAARMVLSFCSGVAASTTNTWTSLTSSESDDVQVMSRMSMDDPGKPPGMVLSAATSFRLPVPPNQVFEFLRSEHHRPKWDIFSANGVQEMAHIANGRDPGNCVSLLRVDNTNSSQSDMLILQESSNDSMGSYVIYAPVDVASVNVVLNGGNPDYVALLQSGFAILPDGPIQHEAGVLEVGSGGSLITVAFQILVDSTPNANISIGSVATVDTLIKTTVERIKDELSSNN